MFNFTSKALISDICNPAIKWKRGLPQATQPLSGPRSSLILTKCCFQWLCESFLETNLKMEDSVQVFNRMHADSVFNTDGNSILTLKC